MRTTKARIAATAATITAVGIAGVAVPTSNAQKYDTPKPATIKMVLKGKLPKFTGPKTVKAGSKLTVVNKTDVRAIGPHTFSLVKPRLIPAKKDWKACGEELQLICGTIAKAHDIDTKTFKIGKPLLDVGKKGWDKSFGKKGDSVYTETKGERHTRKVTAKPGTTLTYFCAVHPNMTGKIKVTK